MQALTPLVALTFVGSALLQVIGVSLLTLTQGFTKPLPTISSLVSFAIAFWLLARLIQSGANLSILMPLLAATVPLILIAVGVFFYGESATVLKVVLLVAASVLVGIASTV